MKKIRTKVLKNIISELNNLKNEKESVTESLKKIYKIKDPESEYVIPKEFLAKADEEQDFAPAVAAALFFLYELFEDKLQRDKSVRKFLRYLYREIMISGSSFSKKFMVLFLSSLALNLNLREKTLEQIVSVIADCITEEDESIREAAVTALNILENYHE